MLRQRARFMSLMALGWVAFVVAWLAGSASLGAAPMDEDSPPPWADLGAAAGVGGTGADTRRGVPALLAPGSSMGRNATYKAIPTNKDKDVDIKLDEPPAELKIGGGDHGLTSDDPWLQPQQQKWRLIILFQHNLPILLQAVDGFRRASDIMAPNTIIVDNSRTKEATRSPELQRHVEHIIRTPRVLNFPELHNFMTDIALERDLEFYFWAHADNYVLPMAPGRDLGRDVLACMRQQVAKAPNWGMLLFSYDHLAAFRTQTMVQVPWDPLVFQYGSECDVYGRIRDAGYAAKACKVHKSYDMKRVLNITDDMAYDTVKRLLDADAVDKKGRNAWREKAMDDTEQAWRKTMKQASREYLVSKWGQRTCSVRGLKCSKPWPYCNTCPVELPDCHAKHVGHKQLREIHAKTRHVFATNAEQPTAFEKFKETHGDPGNGNDVDPHHHAAFS